jgi:ABC-type branched-subunit amino acid transport system ATPase component
MSVLENVKTASLLSNDGSEEGLFDILALCNLEKEADTDASDLSFSKLRFLELARVMAMKPKLLLADEPLSGLSTLEIKLASNLLVKIHDQFGASILITGHLVGHLANLAQELIVLHRGKVLARGSFDEVRSNPAVLETYLGESIAED